MALVNVKESWSKANCAIGRGASAGIIEGTAAKGFTVLFNSCSNSNVLLAVLANDGVQHVPALGEAFDVANPGMLCRRVRVVNPLGPLLYEVLAEYGTANSVLGVPVAAPRIQWAGQKVMEAVNFDAAGVAYKNSIGDIITGVQRPFYDLVYTHTRNEAAATFAKSGYRGTLNSGSQTLDGTSYAAKLCLMENIQAARVLSVDNWYYWEVTYTIIIRNTIVGATDYGWQRRELNKGPRYRPTAGAAPKMVKDLDGRSEARLAADGTLLADAAADIAVLFDDYSAVSWAALGLSTS